MSLGWTWTIYLIDRLKYLSFVGMIVSFIFMFFLFAGIEHIKPKNEFKFLKVLNITILLLIIFASAIIVLPDKETCYEILQINKIECNK